VTTIPLDRALLRGSRDQPGCTLTDELFALLRRCIPIRSCSRRGLPCHLPYGRRGGLLPHRFSLACAPKVRGRREPSAVCSLWRYP